MENNLHDNSQKIKASQELIEISLKRPTKRLWKTIVATITILLCGGFLCVVASRGMLGNISYSFGSILGGVVFWFILIYLITWVIVRNKFKNVSRYNLRIFTIAMIIATISTFGTINKSKTLNVSVTLEEQKQMQEVILQVTNDPESFSEEIHNRFWNIFKKRSDSPEKEILEFKKGFEKNNASRYLQNYYNDALETIKTKKPFKSSEIEEIEQRMLASNPNAKKIIQENNSNMEKIAKGESVSIGGENILIDEENAKKLVNFYKIMYDNLDKLFEKPLE